ncbi:MAG: TIGR00296 family protein [Candidatus Norongarragalinales archaeon]
MLSLEQGRFLVSLARASLKHFFNQGKEFSKEEVKKLREKELGKNASLEALGAFVTLRSLASGLRGCIGYPLPVSAVDEEVSELALQAAFADPRFPPLSRSELDKVIVEVSVLTKPKQVLARKPEDFVEAVKVGRDGLIIEVGGASGLLLPQVAVEEGFDAEKFLDCVCLKAGLPARAWRAERNGKPVARVYVFQAQVFCEEKPGGKVTEKPLGKAI